MLSIVVPAYNEENSILNTANVLCNIMSNASIIYELIFVDDGSNDGTWSKITEACREDQNVLGIKLSRNFGKESAMLAGLREANGDVVALIDCDLQHPPQALVEMYRIWQQGGIDIVEGIKESRGNEPFIYKKLSQLFYYTIDAFGKTSLKNSSDFQLLDLRVVDIIINLPERQRFFRALASWVGFNRAQISFKVEPRLEGTSKFNFYSSAKYAISNITSFSSAPMQFITFMGVLFLILSAVLGVQTLYNWARGNAAEGFTTIILILLFTSSMTMISLGIIGLYIGKIYEEIKFRPAYLVQEKLNCTQD